MTREEAISALDGVLSDFCLDCPMMYEENCDCEAREAIDMAIEALSQPIVAKHFDIQSGYIYCSPEIAENVKVVVRCKDCTDCPRYGDDCDGKVEDKENE